MSIVRTDTCKGIVPHPRIGEQVAIIRGLACPRAAHRSQQAEKDHDQQGASCQCMAKRVMVSLHTEPSEYPSGRAAMPCRPTESPLRWSAL